MLWINFLHLYQPANTDNHVIKEATEMSYYRLVRALEENPSIKFTLNISGCLILRWDNMGYFDLIKRINKLIKKGQIELVGTAAYHPILPLIPEAEAKAQIKENEAIIKKYFKIKPRGFFLPEMAYSPKIAKIIKKSGYKYLVLDEIAHNGKLKQIKTDQIYKDKNSGLKIIFRDRSLSKKYVPDELLKIIKNKKADNKTFISATDGELYGLRHIDHTAEFEKLLKNPTLKTQTISEFIKKNNKIEEVKLVNCNWESTEEELKKKMPYALWINKKNKIQKELWALADLAQTTINKYKKDQNNYWARWHLVRGLASCTFWWSSGKNLGKFSPISWNPDEVERGTNELIRSIRALENPKTRTNKIKGEKLYIKIKKMVWQHHWLYYWKK